MNNSDKFIKKPSILEGAPYRNLSINPHCLSTDLFPHENKSLPRGISE